MRRRAVVAAVLILAGVALVGYGLWTGDQATYSVHVQDQSGESAVPENATVVEYGDLDPGVQDAVREAIESGDSASVSGRPETLEDGYVHYQERYYRTITAVGDASQTTMVAATVGGLVLLGLGVLSWAWGRIRDGEPADAERA